MRSRSTFLLTTLAILIASPAMASDIPWMTDVDAAIRVAQQSNRMVLVHFYTDSCPPCRKLESVVYSKPGVGQQIATNFVPVKINAEHNIELARRMGVDSWPTDVILDSSGKKLTKQRCPINQNAYLGQLAQAARYLGPTRAVQVASHPAPVVPGPRAATPPASPYGIPRAGDAYVPPSQPTQPPAVSGPATPPPTTGGRYAPAPQQVRSQPTPSAPVRTNPTAPTPGAPPAYTPYQPPAAGGTPRGPSTAINPNKSRPQPGYDSRVFNQNRGPVAPAPPAYKPAPQPPAYQPAPKAPAPQPRAYQPAPNTPAPYGAGPGQPAPRPQPQMPNYQLPKTPTAPAPNVPPRQVAPPVTQPPAYQPAPQAQVPPRPQAPPLAHPKPNTPPYGANPYRARPPIGAQPPGRPAPPNLREARAPSQPSPFALDGRCPVELAEREHWVTGDKRFGAVHLGQTYLFAGEAQQKKFLANPQFYAPAISGFDPVLAFDHGQKVAGNRKHGLTLGEGAQRRVYLFASEETLKQFCTDRGRYQSAVRTAEAAQQPVRR